MLRSVRDMKPETFDASAKYLFIFIFLLFLFIPFSKNIVSKSDTQLTEEQRRLASKPAFTLENWRSYPQQYEKYFNDHFAFRSEMIRRYNRLKLFFSQSPNSKKVILGQDGWLFLAPEGGGGDPIADYSGANLFSEEQLKKIAGNLEAQRQWLEARNIEYYLVIAPNKASIYPEFLPSSVIKANSLTRMDQLAAVLKSRTKVTVIDLRQVLYNHKKDMLLYEKTDTHWNPYGAFLAYQQIASTIGKKYPQIKPKELTEFEIVVETRKGGDLTGMIAMQDQLKEDRIVLRLKSPLDVVKSLLTYTVKSRKAVGDDVAFATLHDAQLPRLVMMRDSFATALQPYLSYHFSRAVYIWDPKLRTDIIQEEKPNIVIYELVERYMGNLLKDTTLDE